jgi:hypothetical protein
MYASTQSDRNTILWSRPGRTIGGDELSALLTDAFPKTLAVPDPNKNRREASGRTQILFAPSCCQDSPAMNHYDRPWPDRLRERAMLLDRLAHQGARLPH